jgi:hypothetical protein
VRLQYNVQFRLTLTSESAYTSCASFSLLAPVAASLNVSIGARFAQAPKLTSLPRSGRFAGLIPLLGEERQTLPPFDHGQPSGWTLYLFKLKNLHSASYIILQPHPYFLLLNSAMQ